MIALYVRKKKRLCLGKVKMINYMKATVILNKTIYNAITLIAIFRKSLLHHDLYFHETIILTV